LSDDTIKQFQLGFAPDRWDELIQFFVKKKVNLQEAERAGLIMRSNRSRPSQSSHYDRFRNRIMFPINDLYGNPIGFTSRIVPWSTDKETAKYVNTPETPLYNKSHVLYGLDKAKSTIKKENFVIVVEGNVDVIACHQAGSKNIVASSGTALTLDQIKILKRYTPNLYLAFDVDLAGENATQRGIDVALQQEMNVKIIVVPEGKDPDECIKEDPNKWFEAIKNAKPIMEYYFDLALRDRDIKKIEDQKNIVKIILPVIAKFGDPVEQNYWIKFLADKINVPEYSLRDKLKNLKPNRLASKDSKAFTSKATKEQMAAEIFLGLLIKHSQLVIGYFLNLPTEAFVTADAIALAELIQKCYNSGNQDNVIEALQPQLTQNNLVDFFDYLGLLAEKEYPDLTSSTKPKLTEAMKKELTGEVKKLFTILQVEHLKKEKAELSKKLKEAERSKQSDQVKELLDRISQINRIIHQI
jgi:DNA primase